MTSLYLPLALSAIFGGTAPALSRRLPPSVATWVLSAGGLLAAAGSSVTLGLLAFEFVALAPRLADRAGWSDDVLRQHDPVSTPVGLCAIVAVVIFAVRFAVAAVRRLIAVRDAYRLSAALPDTGSELCVLDLPEAHAVAIPGRPGRIVVTRGLLRALAAEERRALIAHERAHLEHRHHVHQTAAHLAAAVNPFLARLPGSVESSCERWADEDAAALCPRETVADALTRAATRHRLSAPVVVLGAAVTEVADRIGALRAPAPRLVLWRLSLPAAVLLAATVAVALAVRDAEQLFDLARYAYRAGQR